MPKKIREIKSMLLKAGFTFRSGKGSHTKWYHPLIPGALTLSGKEGDDAKPYQEKDAANAIKKVQELETEREEE
ncbi:MAG: type II toxin-antitoxin system HicA family toxin [Microcoleus sp. PH2017_10_PVI_O_A]|uniref:type II toxin-antitoxin system HicA family toxin n=1 Tax=unclassified Microcoleus TaxID=2642155 RepID=UPI001D2AB80A|nr:MULTISPECIES: type II toxin-antitoxin system HicA family toxin [unclassified Microcoleus]TAE82311.1 MAG: type II toxin-antitoxin system HicA family toxin [Oscillatoriales cyanobacterium]MCC3406841.1 type II toxin-antitoxin system HicA family toxin [Microcoleus sp. PH2017_10_PVI_O_A]MCC3460977.1 type II toxin-antitoxin system HicA family toxin [Microcoleus sp. PH2017_11_PCY_U_A]MCC3479498.1 type II toxin-antitoxin system HicA family toxin [Microcoleus sp. PH2017_12_PCY_D_A]MCC3526795.1 type 